MGDRLGPPIFIVGCPRSGTGILQQLLRLHPDVAWITPVTNRVFAWNKYFFEQPRTAFLLETLVQHMPSFMVPRPYRGPFDGSLRIKGMPETSEGHAIWDCYCRLDPHHYLTEEDLLPEATRYFRNMTAWHCNYFGRSRFLCKTPRNALRIRYLKAIYPDAHFIHLVRDGRAVAVSILKRRRLFRGEETWWGLKPPGWQDTLMRPPIVQCGWTWKTCCAIASRDAAAILDPAHYHVLKYEHLASDPAGTLQHLLAALDLSTTDYFTDEIWKYLETLESRNHAWDKRLGAGQRTLLLDEISDALSTWGYVS